MPEYQNPHKHTVHITGPDGKVLSVASRQIVNLPAYYEIYRERGFLISLSPDDKLKPSAPIISQSAVSNKQPMMFKSAPPPPKRAIVSFGPKSNRQSSSNLISANPNGSGLRNKKVSSKPIIGKQLAEAKASEIHKSAVELIRNGKGAYPVSNGIGIGILSYNRKTSLERLINSLSNNTNLNATTVFVSDDGSTDPELVSYLEELQKQSNIVIIRNKTRLGIAENSNRLLRALSRFNYGILLNDDIEILSPGWEHFYIDGLKKSMMHHLVFRQIGVYGATKGDPKTINGVRLNVVQHRPQGALLAFTSDYLKKVGAFNEGFGHYGLEHVEWSSRAYANKMQQEGFYDIEGSEAYVKLHREETSIDNKHECLKNANEKYESLKKLRHEFTADSSIPKVTYVVPFREQERTDSLRTVLNNIRAQKYPDIEIILVEEDHIPKIDSSQYNPIAYYRVNLNEEHLFNKSKAFNLGVAKSNSNKIILHDADMLVINGYTAEVSGILDVNDSCHLGSTVVYADKDSTDIINGSGEVIDPVFERVVGYYEGGSLACTKETYWRIGGFNEDFWGYGCEDCDFYDRMSKGSKYFDSRTYNLLHLHHGRSDGWCDHHDVNIATYEKLKTLTMKQRIDLQVSQVSGMKHI